MKTIAFAATLMLGTAAIAQTGNTVSDPSQSSGPRGITQQGTDPEGQACTPPGYNANTTAYPTCGPPPPPPPRCSKTVTDHCVQAYERGVRR